MGRLRIFLTGPPGIGKTTVIRGIERELRTHGIKVGGIISTEIRDSRGRLGFQLEDISTHKIGTLAHVSERQDGAPTVGKYHVNLFDIERVGTTAIRGAVDNADVVIIDEIGPMELTSKEFILAVKFALDSQKSLIATLHRKSTHPLVNAIRSNPNCQTLEVNMQNRDKIPSEIAASLMR